MMEYYDLCVIGGGASGLVSAIEYKRTHKESRVVILERMPRVGKKLLATGNGRCNLSNTHSKAHDYNHPEFVENVFEKFDSSSNLDFFKSIGLLTTTDSEGRVYPRSNTASSVLDILLLECKRYNITILCDFTVNKLKKQEFFVINENIRAKNVIMACGGKSSPKLGSDGSGFEVMTHLGHTITKLSPALVQIKTETKYVRQLKGIRVKGVLSLKHNDRILTKSQGEILFTDYGVSGIAAMDVSSYVKAGANNTLLLDMASDMSLMDIQKYLSEMAEHNPHLTANDLLIGLLPKKVGQIILKYCHIPLDKKIIELSDITLQNVSEALKNFEIKVLGTQDFDSAQITAGGLSLDEFDSETLESKLVKGLYCCGEVLDIDSKCGGYNLNWAWSSGRLAGTVSGERKK